MRAPIDITGQRFGKLVALRPTDRRKKGSIIWECMCDCGRITYADGDRLRRGCVQSCGCTKRIHNGCQENLYSHWEKMKSRCMNPKQANFSRYGGRGIKVCDEWLNDYAAYREWSLANGFEEGKQLHRIDNDGSYEPSNCKWLTASEHRQIHDLQRKQNPKG